MESFVIEATLDILICSIYCQNIGQMNIVSWKSLTLYMFTIWLVYSL